MSGSPSSGHPNALESEFFRRVDQKLVITIEESQVLEADQDALCMATGIADRNLLADLLTAEITPKTLIAFSLFPAVYVAWANGAVQDAERIAILQAADSLGVAESSPAHQLLDKWLIQSPTDDLIVAWKEFIHAIRPTISDAAFRELREAAMKRAIDIAESAGGILNILNVSTSEKAAIAELQSVFDDAASAAEAASNV